MIKILLVFLLHRTFILIQS